MKDKCASKNRKMCEEPCYSCGKCQSIKQVCTKCTKPYNRKSKCRYSDEQIENSRKEYLKLYDKALNRKSILFCFSGSFMYVDGSSALINFLRFTK